MNRAKSLAGRIEVIEVGGFTLDEVGAEQAAASSGCAAASTRFLAAAPANTLAWRKQFLMALVQRDLPQLGISLTPPEMIALPDDACAFPRPDLECRRAGALARRPKRRCGAIWTCLPGTFCVRALPPWHRKPSASGKIQVARDLFGATPACCINCSASASGKPCVAPHSAGASWEGFVLEALLKALEPDEACFWGTHTGAELDGLFIRGGRRLGIEIKRADAPRLTPSMRHALHDLRLDWLWVIYPGTQAYALDERVRVMPLADAIGLPARAA